ncbi:hypothetical protein FRC07_009781 [Ceratobasidium sp. 392]|nr:hypothetical protein FRC07_009781 [Ceratobasidium sp. 392]
MSFTLGAVLVKGGKVIAHGVNSRTNYDGSCKQPGRKPISMHAEMHSISMATGLTPTFKSQVQPGPCRFEGSKAEEYKSKGQEQEPDRRPAAVQLLL